MADAAAARREARRRRILENSQNRLQLISGKSNSDRSRDIESPIRTIVPDVPQEPSVSVDCVSSHSRNALINGVIPTTESDSLDSILGFNVAADDDQVPSDSASFASSQGSAITSTPQEPAQTLSCWNKITDYKYDIVLLSIIIQFMNHFSLLSFEDTYFFLPVLIYIITKLIWFPSQNISKSKLSNALSLLQAMSSHRVQKIISVTQIIGVISRDICVFLFVTICIQSLLVTLESALNT